MNERMLKVSRARLTVACRKETESVGCGGIMPYDDILMCEETSDFKA